MRYCLMKNSYQAVGESTDAAGQCFLEGMVVRDNESSLVRLTPRRVELPFGFNRLAERVTVRPQLSLQLETFVAVRVQL